MMGYYSYCNNNSWTTFNYDCNNNFNHSIDSYLSINDINFNHIINSVCNIIIILITIIIYNTILL